MSSVTLPGPSGTHRFGRHPARFLAVTRRVLWRGSDGALWIGNARVISPWSGWKVPHRFVRSTK